MCGNALVAATRVLAHGLEARPLPLMLETTSGLRSALVTTRFRCQIAMPAAVLGSPADGETIECGRAHIRLVAVNTGTPHAVVMVEDVEVVPVEVLGKAIGEHARFPENTNVMFVQVIDTRRARMRSWERGGNGETRACGSGSCAAAYVMHLRHHRAAGIYDIASAGGNIGVIVSPDGELTLQGEADLVFQGAIASSTEDRSLLT
jgi:diaminopimelate epimerase